ncbi:MAG: hypothetical protein IPP15_21905 [Saprospiraceae bacterium]|uniref:Uncharacterized protein n=1 Tax=Candidatus Opimibacter skivensis TaxID=2982028 RepID=A0A9D7SZU6_9BACT|nr:hypothetical protein [Candidatus Opimibacter skivensis]
MVNINDFIQSTNDDHPPEGLNSLLLALWYDAKGDWEKSHNIAQDIDTKGGALIHAYLHRKEGDDWNADYWYRKAGEKKPEISINKEWEILTNKFLYTNVLP